MTLQEYIGSLSEKDQFEVAINLAKATLLIWNDYTGNNELSYRDTVVGLTHSVDQQLLQAVIDETVKHLSLNKSDKNLRQLRKQFDDPIVSLQDADWKLPDSVEKTFYSVYNLLEAVLGKSQTTFGESTIYVSINQAIDALETSGRLSRDEIKKLLYRIRNGR